jgi:hypothetical protein
MELPPHDFHGFDALTRRPAQPILHVRLVARAVMERPFCDHFLNHFYIIPRFAAAA